MAVSAQGHDVTADIAREIPTDRSPSVPFLSDCERNGSLPSRWHGPLPVEDQNAGEEVSTEVVNSAKPADVDSQDPNRRPPAEGEDGQQLHCDAVDLRQRTVELPIRANPSENDWVVVEDEWVMI